MNNKIESQLNHIDAQLEMLLSDLKQYSEEDLNRKPSSNAWSAIQLMHHLILAETLSLKYVQKKLSFNPPLKPIGIGTKFRLLLYRIYNVLPVKFKAPEGISGTNLPAYATFVETAEKWRTQRQQLRQYLSTLSADYFQKEIYKHPFAGRMSLQGMLFTFEGHMERHRKQFKKLLAH